MTLKTKNPSYTAIEMTNSGEFFAVIGHKSKGDGSVKTRLLWAATEAMPKSIDLEQGRLDVHCPTAGDAAALLAKDGIPSDIASEALQVMLDRIEERRNGNGGGGAIERETVARAKNGGTILQMVKNQKSGEWVLQVVGEQADAWTTTPGTVDWAKENARLLKNCIAGAQTQVAKRIANVEKNATRAAKGLGPVKVQSISKVVALLGKRLPLLDQRYRTLNLTGREAITCEAIAIHGQRYTDMLSVVAHFRPDLVDLLKSASA
jgi:hypothetical protein